MLRATRAAASSPRSRRVHWPGTCGWVITVSISSSASISAAISAWRTRSTASPTITRSPGSPASSSSVTLIEPSSEFSIGTIAQRTKPSRSAVIVS
jgi:hypothetical protein